MEKQTKTLPFTAGVDTKTDSLLSAKPTRVENMVVRGGTLGKRYGTSQLTTSTSDGSTLTGEALFAFDSELVRINSGKAYSLGPVSGKWTLKPGGGATATHSVKRIVRNTTTPQHADHATANGITVTAWTDTNLHIAVYDEKTGEFYQTGSAIVDGGTGARCVVLGSRVLVFTNNGGNLDVAIVDTTTPTTAPTVVSSLVSPTGGAAQTAFDAVAGPGGAYAIVAYVTGVAGSFHDRLIAVNGAGAVLSSPAATDLGQVGNPGSNDSVIVGIDSNGVGYIVSYGTPAGGTAWFLSFNGTTFATITTYTQITATAARQSAAMVESSSGNMTVFLSSTGIAQPSSSIGSAVINKNAVGTAYATINGTGGLVVQGAAFKLGSTVCCQVMSGATSSVNSTSLQPTAWIMDTGGNVVAKILPATAGNNAQAATSKNARAFTTSTGAVALLVYERGRLNYTSAAGVVIDKTPIGLTRVDLLPTGAGALPAVRIGDVTYVGGSRPSIYDAQEWTDAGFNQFPEGVSAVAAAGGVLTAGTYQYRCLYSWVNAKGELQRSAPSPAVSITVTVNQKVTLTIPTMRLSNRDTTAVNTVQIEVYRTEANGLNFYRVSKTDSPIANSTSATTVSFADDSSLNVPDTSLIANELLYTTGGVYDNIAPPAYKYACAHKSRLIIAGLEDPYEWRSSCVAIRGEMLRFNEAWGGRVPSQTGKIVGVASLDNNLIIFCEQGAYAVVGDGPDLLGNNPWQPPQPITSVSSGPTSWQSICSMPSGVLFQSAQGFYLLDRGLNLQYIGAEVDAYAGYTVRSAVYRPELSEVWIHCDPGSDMPGQQQGTLVPSNGGVCLVFDDTYDQWSVLTNYGGQSAAYYQGKYCRVRSDGTVFQEQPNTYLDSGVAYSSTMETAWTKLAGLQGFQRIFLMELLGAYGGPGNDFTLAWDIGYDYNTTYSSQDTTTFSTVGAFSTGAPFQVRHKPRIQKCEAFRIRLTDTPTGLGRGMSLTDLTLEVGVKKGGYKLQSGQTT